MKIKFIKAHPSGIKEGNVHNVDDKFAGRMIDEGFAEEHTSEEEKAPKVKEEKAPKVKK